MRISDWSSDVCSSDLRLTTLHPKAFDLSLDRIRILLAELGNPHLALPPVFHVAGSKGKGSTTAFLRAMADAAGYRGPTYTSPHLVRFNARIRLSGQLTGDEKLVALLARQPATGGVGNR